MIGVYQATEDVPQLDVDEVEDENFFSVETSLASPEEESGWTRIMIIVGLPSLMLILVIGGAFFMVRRSANKGEFSLEDDMLD
jgi:hypothetical protein